LPVAAVLVGGVQGESGDPVLGTDEGVGVLVEIGGLADRAGGEDVRDAEWPTDVGGVDDDLPQPGRFGAGRRRG
jgi:hypothetical protein